MTLRWNDYDDEDESTHPTESGHYAIMISGDSESVDGHVIYAFEDYQTFAQATVSDGEARFSCFHDEPPEAILAWCGPLPIPAYRNKV